MLRVRESKARTQGVTLTFLTLGHSLLQLPCSRGCTVPLGLHLSQLVTQGTRLGPKLILQPQYRGRGKTAALTSCSLSATRFPNQSLIPSLTRSLWALRSSCMNSRRAPRTASGSRSGDVGEVAGRGDGGSDPGLCSKGLGLLSPSPLPRGGDVLREGATGLFCQDGAGRVLMHPPVPAVPHERPTAQIGSPRAPAPPLTGPHSPQSQGNVLAIT